MDDSVPIIQNMALIIQNVHVQTSAFYIAEVMATIFRIGVVKQVAKVKEYDVNSNFCHVFVHFDHWFSTTETVLFQLALSRALYLDYEIDPRSPWRVSRIPNIYESMPVEVNMDDIWTDVRPGKIVKIFVSGEMIVELDDQPDGPYYRLDSTNFRTMEKMPLHIYTRSPYTSDGRRSEHVYASRFFYDKERSAVINTKEINDDFPNLFATFAKRGSPAALDALLKNYDGYSLYFEKKDYDIKRLCGWDYDDWKLVDKKTKRLQRPSKKQDPESVERS
jgi:hypothetical protein